MFDQPLWVFLLLGFILAGGVQAVFGLLFMFGEDLVRWLRPPRFTPGDGRDYTQIFKTPFKITRP